MANSAGDLFPDDMPSDTGDSDTGSDAPGDYRPISSVDDSDDDHDGESVTAGPSVDCLRPSVHSNGGGTVHRLDTNLGLRTPSPRHRDAPNGVSRLDLNEVDEEEEERRERQREAEIGRAFREDERRRTAPLSAENAVRVMEAMQAVSFVGMPPEWARRGGEDWVVAELRRLRGGGGGDPQRSS